MMIKKLFLIFLPVVLTAVFLALFFAAGHHAFTPSKYKTIQSTQRVPLPALPPPSADVKPDADMQLAFVSRVIDGDTIEVELANATGMGWDGQKVVRYIGMDTPETVDPRKPVECFGHEASMRNKELVQGQWVELKKDASQTDKYGRLLRFVYLFNGTLVDLELVKEGYARVLTIPPDIEYEGDFKAAQQSARATGLGFWRACPAYPFSS